jgi:hypothetical protein
MSYVEKGLDRLYHTAEELLDQAQNMGSATDVTVLELPEGGYYLVPGVGHDLAALQAEHGAPAGWQVSRSASGVSVSGRAGDRSCVLKQEASNAALRSRFRDTPAYLLI